MGVKHIELTGTVQAVTPKAVLLAASDFERWFPLRYCRVVSGLLDRGGWVVLSVPLWILEKKETGSPTPSRSASGSDISPDMLKRLIQLCHPDKHNNSKSSTVATEWLLSLRG